MIAISSMVVIVAALASWPTSALAGESGGLGGPECLSISAEGIEKQMNLHASEILVDCGVLPAGSPNAPSGESSLGAPGASFPGSDVNLITGTETYPHVTQSESFVWSHQDTIVAAYNDSIGFTESPAILLGVSVSHDGGASFTRLRPPSPFTGHGSSRGDPIVVYNEKLGKWFVGSLANGCGAQGIGLWTSTDGDTWTTGSCAHTGTNDDRESMWVDNNPASPFYGRMYISFNNFAVSGGALQVVYSDDGTTWTAPVTVFPSFRRDVQLTGSPGADGTVFLVGQEENGGGVGNSGQQNYMYRSGNGGASWTQTVMGPTFTIPGNTSCGYFPAIAPIWRGTGWGQPAVGPNGVVQYVYAAHGAGADESDIYYVRSTDNGATWSAPIRLNTDNSGQAQWMPSLRVTPSGFVEASWYDRRNTTNGTNYQRFARISRDNGATWGPDEALSTVMIPQPTQPDPNIQACYAGDYNYTTANPVSGFDTWTDGRVSIEPAGPVQKVFFHSVPLPGKVATGPVALQEEGGDRQLYFGGDDGLLKWWEWNVAAGKWIEQWLGNPGEVAGDPFPVQQANGDRQIYFRGDDGLLKWWEWNVAAGKWTEQWLGNVGEVAGDPFPVQQADGGRQIYFRGQEGLLKWWEWNVAAGKWIEQWLG